ncbi:MAG: hypothetical protein MMC23_007929 [Stictis urceolatum]|nr:hypothetical protein [Stictis urceolata]
MKFTLAAVALFVAVALAAPIDSAKRQTSAPNESTATMTGPNGDPVAYDATTMPGKDSQ